MTQKWQSSLSCSRNLKLRWLHLWWVVEWHIWFDKSDYLNVKIESDLSSDCSFCEWIISTLTVTWILSMRCLTLPLNSHHITHYTVHWIYYSEFFQTNHEQLQYCFTIFSSRLIIITDKIYLPVCCTFSWDVPAITIS